MRRLACALAAMTVAAVSFAVPATVGSGIERPTAASAATCSAGNRIPESPTALATLQSSLAWETTQGAGILVAVVDSGINHANPHLTSAMKGGTDLVGDSKGNSGYSDSDGHGTALAGIIAARRITGSGVEGIAPGASLLSVRVFAATDDDTVKAGHGPDVGRLASGIRYAADHHAQIINVALSTTKDSAVLKAATEYALRHHSLVIAAAGNRDSTDSIGTDSSDGPRYPAAYPGVLGVAAANTAGVVTKSSIHGPHVALSAPGQNVATTSREGGDCAYAPDAPATSFATAYASGAAALVAAAHPDETPAEWAYRLEASAVRAESASRTDTAGWGLVQPYDAITLVPGAGLPGPHNPFPNAGTATATATATARSAPTIEHRASPATTARQITIYGGIGAAVVLAVLCILVAARSRRREQDVTPPTAPSGTGLYGSDGADPTSVT